MIEVRAQLKNLRMSPKKVRLVADTIKGMDAATALVRLQFVQKASSPIIAKLLKSAIANAVHNNDLQEESLMVKSIIVNEAKPLHRWKPAAYGASHAYKKRGSHIHITLGLKPDAPEPQTKKAKQGEDSQDHEKQDTAKAAVASKKATTAKKTIEKKSEQEAKKPVTNNKEAKKK